MPNWLKFPLVLTIVGCLSAVSLAGLYSLTAPVKKALAQKETEQALKWVLPEAKEFIPIKDASSNLPIYYQAKNEAGKIIGYAVQGEAMGYAAPIIMMVGVDKEFKILGTKVLDQKETPGLGDKISEVLSKKTWKTVVSGTSPDERNLRPYFQIQFQGKQPPVALKQHGGDIEAITGATISSKAVVDAINLAIKNLREVL
ncbi:MAG: RnfABCDGE type electron transport complex subunit G [Pseudomonadota bacterium]